MIKLAKIDTMPPKEMLKENYVKKETTLQLRRNSKAILC